MSANESKAPDLMHVIVQCKYAAWITETLSVGIPRDTPREQWADAIRGSLNVEMIDSTGPQDLVDGVVAEYFDNGGPLPEKA